MKGQKAPRFDPKTFEDTIRQKWQSDGVYKTRPLENKEDKEYILVMFPYPSGAGLHTGHARIYTGTDVLARYYRMMGKSVLHPMGWDAFGLPAENAAIKQKKAPQDISAGNIANFKKQFNLLGMSYDWDKEIDTTDPQYYAVTQWLFIEFFKHGLLYKKDTQVYYCPVCKTGLAQEEVLGDGTHERCGSLVEKRTLPQWIFRIQEYADSLLEGLEGLDWPKGILEMQKNWIGKKEGIEITYPVVDEKDDEFGENITCFTTRPETNFGATFIVLAPEHSFAQKLVKGELNSSSEASKKDISDYVSQSLRKTERERMTEEKTKTGVFTGYYAVNSLNGKKLPIWISDFVLVNVGTGAVVGVPAHDKRDYDFAANFNLEIIRVVEGPQGDRSKIENIDQVQEESGKMYDSKFLDTMDIQTASSVMMDYLEKEEMGKRVTSYHLREWIFSRQRYWGEPIPMVYCQKCADKGVSYWDTEVEKGSSLRLDKGPKGKTFGTMVDEIKDAMSGWFPLPESELPLTLPYVKSYEPTETGKSPLSSIPEWLETTCPHCGEPAERETDTMPNWAGSCWYFLAYAGKESLSGKPQNFLSDENLKNWLPVNWYIGGAEHAVLHLLYARFWMHALNDLGSVTFREPFTRLRNVGMVQAEDGRKMSKSLGNVINPDDVIFEYGADALRVYEMFMAPFGQEIQWSTQTLQGSYRFVKRIWQIYMTTDKITNQPENQSEDLASELQTLIEKISKDIPNVKFNTSIAAMMEFLNKWEASSKGLFVAHAQDFLKLLSPFAPYMSDYLWQTVFDQSESIHISQWPVVNQSLIEEKSIELPIQINGKVRDKITISASMDEKNVIEMALQSEKVQTWINGQEYTTIYIPGKIVNFVVRK